MYIRRWWERNRIMIIDEYRLSNYETSKLNKKTPRFEDYELSHHYCTGIQESFQASWVFNKIAVITVKFFAKYHGTLSLTKHERSRFDLLKNRFLVLFIDFFSKSILYLRLMLRLYAVFKIVCWSDLMLKCAYSCVQPISKIYV